MHILSLKCLDASLVIFDLSIFFFFVNQANISAREGRVMIFNLVEAAQEFLSEIASAEQSTEAVSQLFNNAFWT